ncbi:hypothetical protein [Nitrobacter hamburgensis]|nr:hypothetical protein [Nitrobacter hamburgensis]
MMLAKLGHDAVLDLMKAVLGIRPTQETTVTGVLRIRVLQRT